MYVGVFDGKRLCCCCAAGSVAVHFHTFRFWKEDEGYFLKTYLAALPSALARALMFNGVMQLNTAEEDNEAIRAFMCFR